jgi:hypothetical protein
MDKKLVGLLGAAAALTTFGGLQSTPAQATELGSAATYRDLLDPVPDALAALKADDARLAETPAADTKLAQYDHHHHHHHHHHVVPRVVRHILGGHHHHHHHHHHHD